MDIDFGFQGRPGRLIPPPVQFISIHTFLACKPFIPGAGSLGSQDTDDSYGTEVDVTHDVLMNTRAVASAAIHHVITHTLGWEGGRPVNLKLTCIVRPMFCMG